MAARFSLPIYSHIDNDGRPLSGCRLRFFENRTTTPKAVFADKDLLNSLGTSIQADSAGRFPSIWLQPSSYTIRFEDAAGQVISAIDDYSGVGIDSLTITDITGLQAQLSQLNASVSTATQAANGAATSATSALSLATSANTAAGTASSNASAALTASSTATTAANQASSNATLALNAANGASASASLSVRNQYAAAGLRLNAGPPSSIEMDAETVSIGKTVNGTFKPMLKTTAGGIVVDQDAFVEAGAFQQFQFYFISGVPVAVNTTPTGPFTIASNVSIAENSLLEIEVSCGTEIFVGDDGGAVNIFGINVERSPAGQNVWSPIGTELISPPQSRTQTLVTGEVIVSVADFIFKKWLATAGATPPVYSHYQKVTAGAYDLRMTLTRNAPTDGWFTSEPIVKITRHKLVGTI